MSEELLDHSSANISIVRHLWAERLGRLHVNRQLEFDGLDRQADGGLCAAQDAIDMVAERWNMVSYSDESSL